MILELDYKPINLRYGYIGSKKDYKLIEVYDAFEDYLRKTKPSNELGYMENDVRRRIEVTGWELTKTINGDKCMLVDTEFKGNDMVYNNFIPDMNALLRDIKLNGILN